ncbi:hypothetical protein D3C74_507880 [compost metagenome]
MLGFPFLHVLVQHLGNMSAVILVRREFKATFTKDMAMGCWLVRFEDFLDGHDCSLPVMVIGVWGLM